MYSVGYAGFYGIALMMASYQVLFISIVAHAAQFTFLTLVEEPHIDKTYNKPPPRRTRQNSDRHHEDRPSTAHSDGTYADYGLMYDSVRSPAPMHHIVGSQNTDFHRLIDVTVVLISFYMFLLAALTPDTFAVRSLFVINAFLWRMWYSLGLGYILDRQSKKKNWTRHFIKHGDSKEEAWRQWKYLHHLSMVMSHGSLAAAAWKVYCLPPDWFVGLTLLRHVLGIGLIALQKWTAMSIYDSLGEFGWFSGDFFFEPPASNLTYSGIYRFLNNPERVLGLAGVWGVALITWNASIFYLAATAHILNLAFLQFVERPHMQK
jgi:phosphatidylethanolamine N-methyltransferase